MWNRATAQSTTPLAGRAALVTGASGGIGRAVAVALAARGADVCVVGRDKRRLAETVRDISAYDTAAVCLAADLTQDGRIDQLVGLVDTQLGRLDVLVHAAGIYTRGQLATTGIADLDALYETNVRLPFRLTQAALPLLIRRRGDVVFVNSTQGLAARGGVGQYAATHHAMRAIADSLREEVNVAGVRVTTLHVGRTATNLQERIFIEEGRPYAPEFLVQPDDVAHLVVSVVTLPAGAQVTTLTIWPTRPPT